MDTAERMTGKVNNRTVQVLKGTWKSVGPEHFDSELLCLLLIATLVVVFG